MGLFDKFKKKSKAEDYKTEDFKAEDYKAGNSKAENSKAENSKAENSKAEDYKAEDYKAEDYKAEDYIDDVTFIRDIKHIQSGPWHQYDVLLAAQGYGWDYMISSADYMAAADLENISQVTSGFIDSEDTDITELYKKSNCKCSETEELKNEAASLSVAGISKTLKAPMKIVWFNQTQVLRFFTIVDDETLIKKYIETVIRRTFGTDSAMKLAKPIPKQ